MPAKRLKRPPTFNRAKHCRRIAASGGSVRSEAKSETARRNGANGGRPSAPLEAQAAVFAEAVERGGSPPIGPRLTAYILGTAKLRKLHKAAKACAGPRTLWTITAEAMERAG